MRAIVLAGGQGTRLRSMVSDVPKPMAPIGGRPFLAYLLDRLEHQGVTDVTLAIGYLGERIEAVLGARWGGLALRYVVEAEPLGTGGALRQALNAADGFPVFAMNGDSYVACDLADMLRRQRESDARLSVAVRREANTSRFGTVVVADERIVGFASERRGQPGWINCGLYLFGENVLADPALPDKFSFESDFLEPRAAALRPLAYEVSGYFIDIGVPEDLRRAQHELPGRLHVHAAPRS
ncbi:MAG TPA: nucleotidyltransferase family protein [Stellaceae bacterium]|nr:nucleotidyltransferase family protein [Stellaceae bacterium]